MEMKCKSLFKVHIADTEFIKSTYLYLINEKRNLQLWNLKFKAVEFLLLVNGSIFDSSYKKLYL